MRILGIDPGTERTGYGVIEVSGQSLTCLDYGCIITDKGISLPEKLLSIHERATGVVAKWSPDIMAVEQVFFSHNARTAFQVGQARGVILLVAAAFGMELDELSPVEVKSAVVGYGNASKEQVKAMTRVILGLDRVPEPDDAADALACAIASSVKRTFKAHLERVEDRV
ncbi:MAG: crossover junction endodeoxyribonuclease RuvC [Firmicutes bacterium]|nr:crossover junction endodeoxyribonuclease RuvC [Candidatus Fermentithermobacillaceae bacterium]